MEEKMMKLTKEEAEQFNILTGNMLTSQIPTGEVAEGENINTFKPDAAACEHEQIVFERNGKAYRFDFERAHVQFWAKKGGVAGTWEELNWGTIVADIFAGRHRVERPLADMTSKELLAFKRNSVEEAQAE